jgi:hypothetical protein
MRIRAIAAAAFILAACGRFAAPTEGRVERPTGADELVLRVDVGGGFIPLEYTLRSFPVLSIFGDGRLITQGPQIEIYPGPALPNLQARAISDGGVDAILEAADDAGLLGPDRDYDFPCIADAGTTTFTLNAGGATHVVSAYALFEGAGDCPGVDVEARAKLVEFQNKLGDLASWLPEGSLGEERPFVEDELRVFVRPYSASPEPGLDQRAVEWPLSTSLGTFGEQYSDLEDTRCGVVSGADHDALRDSAQLANELTPWVGDGVRYQLILRPLLPDEHGC